MHVKDESISRYPEWDAYARQSNRLIPFKMLAVLPAMSSRLFA